MDQSNQFREILEAAVTNRDLRRAVFSSPRERQAEIRRVDVRPVRVRGQDCLQFARRTRTQEFHANLAWSEAAEELWKLAAETFRDVRLETSQAAWDVRFRRRGACSLTACPVEPQADAVDTAHDRRRSYLIPADQPCPFLERIGVMDAQGHVRARASRKFRQINHYLQLIHGCLTDLPTDGPLQVVDFGCGKSYLTFATWHLLTNILGRDCRITGLDRRNDVLDDCRRVAESLGITNLQFLHGDIASCTPDGHVHLAISLHACDTATDDALLQAIRWQTEVILAVPCCQHELAHRMQAAGTSPPLLPGILNERFCALATDAMRTAALQGAGYRADVIEFIDTEHTPKNLMIRAFRQAHDRQNPPGDSQWAGLVSLRERFGLPPLKLERMLTKRPASAD